MNLLAPPPLCWQLISGWFYLLGEEFGRSKHLRVTSQRNKPMRSPEDGPVRCGESCCIQVLLVMWKQLNTGFILRLKHEMQQCKAHGAELLGLQPESLKVFLKTSTLCHFPSVLMTGLSPARRVACRAEPRM